MKHLTIIWSLLLCILFGTQVASAQSYTMKGTVTDANGPVIGAAVTVKDNPTVGTNTDVDGKPKLALYSVLDLVRGGDGIGIYILSSIHIEEAFVDRIFLNDRRILCANVHKSARAFLVKAKIRTRQIKLGAFAQSHSDRLSRLDAALLCGY